jgi:HlyD family secretion protein
MSPLIRRSLIAIAIVAALAAAFWWIGRPKPIAVTVKEIDRGNRRIEHRQHARRHGRGLPAHQAVDDHGRPHRGAGGQGRRPVQKGQLLMKLWNDDQQAQSTLALAQVATARQRVTEACTRPPTPNARRQRQARAARKGLRLRARGNGAHRGAGARAAATRRRPTSRSSRRGSMPRASSRAHRALRALRRHHRQDRRRSRRVLDALAARRADAAGDRPDRRLLPLRHGADGRDRRAQDQRRPAGAHQPRRAARQGPSPARCGASRPTSRRWRSRRARSTSKRLSTTREAPGKLLVGYSADVEVVLAVRNDVVRVPTSALLEGGRVLVAGGDGKLEERTIKAGVANWEFTEVSTARRRRAVVTSLEREGRQGRRELRWSK